MDGPTLWSSQYSGVSAVSEWGLLLSGVSAVSEAEHGKIENGCFWWSQ